MIETKLRNFIVCIGAVLVVGCQEKILHNLDEGRANRAQLVLAKSGIQAQKLQDVTGWSISVPASSAEMSLAQLERERVVIPEAPEEKPSSSFIPSADERSYQLERQVANGLEHTIQRLPSVLEARVHIFREQDTPFEIGKVKQGSASVLLITKSDGPVIGDDDIRKLVAGATGLKQESVVVVRSALIEKSSDESENKSTQIEREATIFLTTPQVLRSLFVLCIGGALVLLFAKFRGRGQSGVRATKQAYYPQKKQAEEPPRAEGPTLVKQKTQDNFFNAEVF